MSDDVYGFADVPITLAGDLAAACPGCGGEVDVGDMEEDAAGVLWPTEGGYRTCEGCGAVVQIAGLSLRMHRWPTGGRA